MMSSPEGALLDPGGWSFPLRFTLNAKDKKPSPILTSSDTDRVRRNLEILLRTLQGERIMRPDYGCGLEDCLFNNVTPELVQGIRSKLQEGIRQWLPEVELDQMTVQKHSDSSSRLSIQIHYHLKHSDLFARLHFNLEAFVSDPSFIAFEP